MVALDPYPKQEPVNRLDVDSTNQSFFKDRHFIITTLLLYFGILIGIVSFSLFSPRNLLLSRTTLPTTPTVQPSGTQLQENTYTNTKYNFSIIYPHNYLLNPALPFAIKFPLWNGENPELYVTLMKKDSLTHAQSNYPDFDTGDRFEGLLILVFPNDNQMNLTKSVYTYRDYAVSQYFAITKQTYSPEITHDVIAKRTWFHLSGFGTFPEDDYVTQLGYGGKILIVKHVSSDNENNQSDFEKIFSSITFPNGTPDFAREWTKASVSGVLTFEYPSDMVIQTKTPEDITVKYNNTQPYNFGLHIDASKSNLATNWDSYIRSEKALFTNPSTSGGTDSSGTKDYVMYQGTLLSPNGFQTTGTEKIYRTKTGGVIKATYPDSNLPDDISTILQTITLLQ